jgi:DNA-binding transcriptional ArsR family regulator
MADDSKITLDRETFKALASDTRLDILKNLDGKPMGLNDIAKVTNLNKATLHEHLAKLNEAGLIKRTEREGHKWVYYRLTWKGESLLHPENTRIVVLFTVTFVALAVAILNIISYIKGTLIQPIVQETQNQLQNGYVTSDGTLKGAQAPSTSAAATFFQNPLFLYAAAACFAVFTVVCIVAVWRYRVNKSVRV